MGVKSVRTVELRIKDKGPTGHTCGNSEKDLKNHQEF